MFTSSHGKLFEFACSLLNRVSGGKQNCSSAKTAVQFHITLAAVHHGTCIDLPSFNQVVCYLSHLTPTSCTAESGGQKENVARGQLGEGMCPRGSAVGLPACVAA